MHAGQHIKVSQDQSFTKVTDCNRDSDRGLLIKTTGSIQNICKLQNAQIIADHYYLIFVVSGIQ